MTLRVCKRHPKSPIQLPGMDMMLGSRTTLNRWILSKSLHLVVLSSLSFACQRDENIVVPEPEAASTSVSSSIDQVVKTPSMDNEAKIVETPSTKESVPVIDIKQPEIVVSPTSKPKVPMEAETPKPIETVPEMTPPVEMPQKTETPVVKRFTIVGQASNRCITAPNALGMQFEIRDCIRAENQLFTLELVGTNAMKIVTNQGHVMEIRGDAVFNSAVVQTAVYQNKPTQKWSVQAWNYASFEALNVLGTNYTLDAVGTNTENGTKIQIWSIDTPFPNQRWVIQEI
jgi:hypothetical protein